MKKVKLICKIVGAVSAIYALMEFVDIFSKACMLHMVQKCLGGNENTKRFVSAFENPEILGASGYMAAKLRFISYLSKTKRIEKMFE